LLFLWYWWLIYMKKGFDIYQYDLQVEVIAKSIEKSLIGDHNKALIFALLFS